MKTVYLRDTLRSAFLGLMLAALAFSWALATNESAAARAKSPGGANRAVGSNLRFSNPFLLPGQDSRFPAGGDAAADPDGFDLGDACIGSQLARYVSALGGVQNYAFTSTDLSTFPGLALQPSGRLSGTPTSVVGTQPTFTSTVLDAAGVSRSGIFRLNALVCPPGTFRFAMDRLPLAQVGHDYITNIDVLSESGPAPAFSVVIGSITFNGTPLLNLQEIGLNLSADGTLAGRPLASGTLAFTARATRGTQTALDRSGTINDQPLTISIAAEERVQTVLATSDAKIKGSLGRTFRNSASFRFFLNSGARSNSDFANAKLVLRFGTATFTTTLDAFGQSRVGPLRVAIDSAASAMKLQLIDQDFGTLLGLGLLPDRSNVTVVVEMELGNTFIGSEPIQFDARVRRGRYDLHYRLGKERQLAGLFQILTVRAADTTDGAAFKVSFLISHVKGRGLTEFGTATTATVRIGPNFSDSVTLSRGRGKFAPPGVQSLKIDSRRKQGQLTTYSINQSLSGIPPSTTGQAQTFLLGMDVTTTTTQMSGDASRRIFPIRFR